MRGRGYRRRCQCYETFDEMRTWTTSKPSRLRQHVSESDLMGPRVQEGVRDKRRNRGKSKRRETREEETRGPLRCQMFRARDMRLGWSWMSRSLFLLTLSRARSPSPSVAGSGA